ncbi:MAG: endonuclease/exonuclease/phosphatase family protein [Hyphomonas sp.]|uniref:endonuclease/exonuclease/phosphatase family protein n=1 Tax=Hyphomonas sp. TaxID=87 RepID=UPI0017A08937|nr:endonuclease/exonuclease/phosphatase family protein [Hyphomonas sp.]MBA3067853.1 endonuclease/exonuclease/phosphatase family protein [Hyphomonas sp.]MBU3920136.1 endonuclease/exonuclease/phosphatase family protein [Alphaproteobacteria bacterium]MBU4062409.1 endonuclease/exonuclease/phosphatase family protein [Alphaproteobacteria bacterium]MBU4165982.1 endonuclease/exonuclease/phosphatase family protein [Alphaproteobacteria bacterium]
MNLATRFQVLFAVLGLAACQTGQEQLSTQALRVATYNIRLDTDSDGENAWAYRRSDVAALIQFYDPDVFGMQEVLPSQLGDLKIDLGDYVFVGVGRDDGAEQGEFASIAYRRDRFESSDQGTFWLSETPNLPSVGWDAAFPRIVTWTRLTHLPSGTKLLVLNSHWDHVGGEARLHSGRMIHRWIAEHHRVCESVVVLGDFNSVPSDASYEALLGADSGFLADTIDISRSPPFGPKGTYNGFDINRSDPEPIDHVLVSRDVQVLRHGVITQQSAGRLPSDHYPIIVDIGVPRCGRNGEPD